MNKVAVYGGLGNQMFQYALCTALNEKGQKTRLSFSRFLHYRLHDFELTKAFIVPLSPLMKIQAFLLTKAAFFYKQKWVTGFFRRLINKYESTQNSYKEKAEFVFDENVFKQQHSLLTGTWQAEKYFINAASLIKKQFVFKKPADTVNTDIINRINNCNAVSIHIRRTNYLNAEWQKQLYVIKDAEYYHKAAAVIKQKVANPFYFIFSDDMEWAKEQLQLSNCFYVDNNRNGNSYIDMYLMSLCKHNIIANSTFSWWGAWLNSYNEKIVIMPAKWMNTNNCEGIFPEAWIKINV
jgi:Glycosyl transferase family 11